MKNFLVFLFVFSSAFCFVGKASSQPIFDGGSPDRTTSLIGFYADHSVAAADFMFTDDVILKDVHFWSTELDGVWDGTLEYYLFIDDGGKPASSPFLSGDGQNIVKNATGILPYTNITGYIEYEYSFDLEDPVYMAANTTYWLGLHLYESFDWVEIAWEDTTPSGFGLAISNDGTFDNWQVYSEYLNQPVDLAFNLTGEIAPVPEPATMLLLGTGLVGLAGISRKKFFKKK